jgi:DNA-binding MarR family transcriptional regulator
MNLSKKEKTVWELLSVAGKARHHLNQVLGRYYMSVTSYHLLRVAGAVPGDPVSVRELAKASGVLVPDMTRILDRMESLGWIYRKRDTEDRRVVLVHILEDGRSALSEVEEIATATCEEITRYFDDADLIGLSEHLKNIVDAVEECHA